MNIDINWDFYYYHRRDGRVTEWRRGHGALPLGEVTADYHAAIAHRDRLNKAIAAMHPLIVSAMVSPEHRAEVEG